MSIVIKIFFRYLVTGDLPLSIALAFRVGESTVRLLIKEVCQVLIKVLQPIYMSQPSEEKWKSCAEGFWKRWNVPNCIGAVDGKHYFAMPSQFRKSFLQLQKILQYSLNGSGK